VMSLPHERLQILANIHHICLCQHVFTFCGRLSGQPRHLSVVKQVVCRGSPAMCFILALWRKLHFPAI
jgi:hypothetical protein